MLIDKNYVDMSEDIETSESDYLETVEKTPVMFWLCVLYASPPATTYIEC